MWTEGENEQKSLRFRMKTYMCGRGLLVWTIGENACKSMRFQTKTGISVDGALVEMDIYWSFIILF